MMRNVYIGLVVLLTAMYIPGPSQFTSFPSLLLLMTLSDYITRGPGWLHYG